jgi:hypothetical protein
VYPVPGYGGDIWYLIAGGQVIAATRVPGDHRSARRCLEALENAFSATRRLEPPHDHEAVLLVAGWFRAHPEHLDWTFSPEAAKEICRRQDQTSGGR